MTTKDEIRRQIKDRLGDVRDRARVLARALKARGEIAAARRRLRAAFAELGEEVYARVSEDASGTWQGDELLEEFRVRIDGLKAEVRQRERALEVILAGKDEGESSADESQDESTEDHNEEEKAR